MERWSDETAKSYCETYGSWGEDVALRVYTTRLLGRDPSLVLHGGGNTSVKTTRRDELGREVAVLCVKGSGWDMGDIEPAGLPAVGLAPLRELRALASLSDEAMVNASRRHLLDVSSPTPSVETLLHAFLPHKFIDHTHADAILALADQKDASEICARVFGRRFGLVPYIMPGFLLAKSAVEIYERDPEVEGLILINHGIFTFGPSARLAYERMIEAVAAARAYIQSKAPVRTPTDSGMVTADYPRHLAALRGCLRHHREGIGHQVLLCRNSAAIGAFLARPNVAELATRGPATPDHVIRTKQKPLLLPDPSAFDAERYRAEVARAIEGYVADYHAYFEMQTREKQVDKKPVHPLPVVFLAPWLGLICAGRTMKAAAIAADIYEHTIDTIAMAERVGAYQPLPDAHLFDMEYWSLEQAKLGKKQPKPLEGMVTLITGAAGGIGRATASVFAEAGSNLALTDQAGTDLEALAGELASRWGVSVATTACDLTAEDQVQGMLNRVCGHFGGLDVVISNAGVAPTGPIDEASAALRRSLEINLMAHQFVSAAAAAIFRAQGGGGCLLFNASKSAFNPGAGFGAYSVPKAALIALMKQYAIELAPLGVRCAAVNADRVRTPLLDMDAISRRAAARGLKPEAYFRANLLGLEVLPEDVARAFYHLSQSPKTTAAVFTVDGGNIAASPR